MAVIVNIHNAHDDNSQWNATGGYWDINVRTDDGFVFQGDVKAGYTNTGGYPKSVVLEQNGAKDWAFGKLSTKTNAKTIITITGETASGGTPEINITNNLTLCQPIEPLPSYIIAGETLTVTIQANDGTEFDTEKSTPKFYYENEIGYPKTQYFTISSDKKTATGSIQVNANWSGFAVIGIAYPVTVVGGQYGAINVYLVTLDELAEFSAKRFFKETGTDPSTGAPIYENIDLGKWVNRIKRIYADVPESSKDAIKCGNYDTGIEVKQPDVSKITLDFGSVIVPAHNKNTLDYDSEVNVFLPFRGFIKIPTDYVGKTISLSYDVNIVTGDGVAKFTYENIPFQVEKISPSTNVIYLTGYENGGSTIGSDIWDELIYYGLEPFVYLKWFEDLNNGRNNDSKIGYIKSFKGFNIFADVSPIGSTEMTVEEQQTIIGLLESGVYIE